MSETFRPGDRVLKTTVEGVVDVVLASPHSMDGVKRGLIRSQEEAQDRLVSARQRVIGATTPDKREAAELDYREAVYGLLLLDTLVKRLT